METWYSQFVYWSKCPVPASSNTSYPFSCYLFSSFYLLLRQLVRSPAHCAITFQFPGCPLHELPLHDPSAHAVIDVERPVLAQWFDCGSRLWLGIGSHAFYFHHKCWDLRGGWQIQIGLSLMIGSVRLEEVFSCRCFVILMSSTGDFSHFQSPLFQIRIGGCFVVACSCSCSATATLPYHLASSWGQRKATLGLWLFLFCFCLVQAWSLIRRRCYCSSAELDSWLLDRYWWWTSTSPRYYHHACDSHVHPSQNRCLASLI